MSLDIEEKDSRYRLARERMLAQGLDALIVVGNAQVAEKGFVKYLTNYKNGLNYVAVVFPYEGEAELLVPNTIQEYWAGRSSWIRNIRISPNLGEGLVKSLKAMGLSKTRLGLINSQIIPADAYLTLIKNCPQASVVDATRLLEELRMIKSSKEIKLIKTSAALAVLSFERLAKILRVGITEREIVAEVDRELIANGAEDIFHLFSSDPDNMFAAYAPTDRVIQRGDIVIMNTELNSPGGYWVQMVRTSFVGKPNENIERMYDTLLDIRLKILEELRPNRKMSEIANALKDYIMKAGYVIGVNFGHGLGLDLVERPRVESSEDTILAPGMVIVVHPQLVLPAGKGTIWLADTYLVTDSGAESLTAMDPLAIKTFD
jgi:Xaa-Pro aminopeptidase